MLVLLEYLKINLTLELYFESNLFFFFITLNMLGKLREYYCSYCNTCNSKIYLINSICIIKIGYCTSLKRCNNCPTKIFIWVTPEEKILGSNFLKKSFTLLSILNDKLILRKVFFYKKI